MQKILQVQLDPLIIEQAQVVAERMQFTDLTAYARYCIVSDVQRRTPPKAPTDPKYIRRK